MNDAPGNYEFKQQLAALSLHDQLSIWVMIRRRLKRRVWQVLQFDYVAPVMFVIGWGASVGEKVPIR